MAAPTLPDYPGPLRTGLRWRALAPADVEAWYGLVRRMAEADRPVWSETREDLAQYLASPANDPALTTLAGFDGGGTLRAAGSARPPRDPPSRTLGAGWIRCGGAGGSAGRATAGRGGGRGARSGGGGAPGG